MHDATSWIAISPFVAAPVVRLALRTESRVRSRGTLMRSLVSSLSKCGTISCQETRQLYSHHVPPCYFSAAGNRISGVPGVLCDDDDEYMGGLVGELTENKCDAILCPPGTSSPVGRQEEANSPCTPCPGGTDEERKERAPYFGMLKCGPISAER